MPAVGQGSGRSSVGEQRAKRPSPPRRTPTRTQVRQAEAQEGQYRSQGAAVKKRATRATQLARSVPKAGDAPQTRARDQGRAQAYVRSQYTGHVHIPALGAGTFYVKPHVSGTAGVPYRQGTTVPPDVALAEQGKQRQAARAQQQAMKLAPVLSVLEQTTRPIHGIAAGTRAAIHGKNVAHAAGRGFSLKDKSLFSDVLKDLGVKGPTAGIAGFALDVVLDPTTYVTGGAGSVAGRTASKAASRVERKALAAGLTAEQAKRFGEFAGKQAARRAGTARGVDMRIAGRSLPGVTRATATAGRAAARASGKPGRAVSGAARKIAGDFSTGVVPEGIDRGTYGAIRSATRTARSTSSREIYKVRQQAAAVNRAIGDKDYQSVLDAIEAGTVRSLPADLKQAAQFLEARFKYAKRVEQQAGIRGGTIKNYVPHVRADLADDGKGVGQQSVGARRIVPSSSRHRTDDRTLAEIRQAEPGKYVEDPGALLAARMSDSAIARSRAELNRRLGDLGRRIKQRAPVDVRSGEAVYHLKGSDIRMLDLRKAEDQRELQAFVSGSGRRGGQYVALNQRAVDRALKTVQPGADKSSVGMVFDKVQGTWKLVATQPNPGFHVRNFIGDLQNAYLGQRGSQLGRNLAHSSRALTELGRQEKAQRTLSLVGRRIDPGGKGLKIGGEHVSYGQLIAEAEKVGGIRSGFVSRELHDLLEGKAVRPKTRAEALRRWANNREDVVRLATYIGARKRGLDPEKAAAYVAKHHFDYSDLTELERRVLRRVMPFWVFSARNIPLQMRSLVGRPGKFAQYEKVRDEIAKAFGYEDGWEGDLSESEQRSAPFGIRIKGKPYTISLGPSGLPLTDLNEFPTSANPAKQADEWINRAMSLVTPAIKTPVELWSNMSFFFREPIERDDAPLVPVPTWLVKTVPERYRKGLGLVPDYVDKRSGKKQWAAPARLVYALGVLPGPFSFLNRISTPSDRPGQDTGSKALAYLGPRVRPIDQRSTEINRLYDERGVIDKRMRSLNQRGVHAANATPEYRALQAREKDVTSHIMALRTQRGDKIIPGARAPRPSLLSPEAQAALESLGRGDGAEFSPEAQRALESVRESVGGGSAFSADAQRALQAIRAGR